MESLYFFSLNPCLKSMLSIFFFKVIFVLGQLSALEVKTRRCFKKRIKRIKVLYKVRTDCLFQMKAIMMIMMLGSSYLSYEMGFA